MADIPGGPLRGALPAAGRVARALKVKPAERSGALRMTAFMLVVWSGFSVGASGVESLLFTRAGPETLAYLYVAVGLLNMGAMAALGRAMEGRLKDRLITWSPVAIAAFAAGGRLLAGSESPAPYQALWLGMMLAWTVQTSMSWALASSINDARQAKRLFPVYGAAMIGGMAAGGLATGPVAALTGTENLIWVWSATALAGFPLARWVLTRPGPPTPAPAPARPRLGPGMRAVRRSPFLMWLAAALPALAALYFLVARIFAGAATERFPDPAALAGFLGAFSALAMASALAVSLLAASRLFSRFGVIPAITLLPAAYAGGFALIALAPGFAPVAAIRFVQFVWVNGIWMPGWNSLLSVVPPQRRERIRIFMDGVPYQAGVVSSGVLLLAAGIEGWGWLLYASGAALGAAGLTAMLKARRPYRNAVMEALREGHASLFRDEDDPFTGLMNDPVARRVVLEAASDPEPGARRLALEVLGTGPEADSVCGRALDDGDADVRAAALRTLMRGTGPPPPQVEALLSDPDPEVRAASLEVIRRRAALQDPDFRRLIRDPSPRVRATAAATRPSDPASVRLIRAMASSADPAERRVAADALPLFGSSEGPLEALVRDPDHQVRRAAAAALAQMGDDGTRRLILALSEPAAEEAALEGLGPALEENPDLLGEWAAQRGAEAVERARSAAALAAGNGAREGFLKWVLASSAETLAARALRAARYAGSPEAVEIALTHLGGNDAMKGAALESLEAAGPPSLRFVLEVWEPAPPAEPVPAAAEVARWARSPDPIVRAAAALAAGGAPGAGAAGPLQDLRRDPDPLVREAAALSLSGEMETLGTLTLMERLVFLRGVHLFAELDPADLKHVAAAMTEHSFEDGETIARAGEPGSDMHIVVTGSIAVTGPGGEAIANRSAGEHVGEMAVISGEPRSAGLVASGAVRTLSLERGTFERILRDRPATSMAVMRVLCQRLSELAGARDWH